MPHPILYCGDTSLTTAASYLGGVLTAAGWEFDYLPSDQPISHVSVPRRQLYIVSDYPAARMTAEIQQQIVDRVAAGAGLLMIGGWESFHGLGGDWDGTPLSAALPVEVATVDDRRNCDHVILARPAKDAAEHPILTGLPWDKVPPVIGGYNAFQARPASQTLLLADHYAPQFRSPDQPAMFDACGQTPLLVVGECGQGRVAALATDLAPHWVGPLVDWGATARLARVAARAPGAEAVEVGALYAQFVRQLVAWTGRLSL